MALLETARGAVSMYVVQGLGLGRISCEHGMYVLSFCFIEGFFLSSCFWGVIRFGSGVLCNLLMSAASLETARM